MQNTRLIGVSGKKRHGKDTVANMIISMMADNGVEYTKHAFGTKVKEVAAVLTGIPADQWETTEQKDTLLGREWDSYDKLGLKTSLTRRKFMTKLGSDVMTTYFNKNTWVNAIFASYTQDSNWVVSDVRFYNEVNAMRQRDGVIIRVIDPRKSDPNDTHPSEVELDSFSGWDYVIVNDSDLTELERRVRVVLIKMGLL